jgi:dipeptidase E
MTMRSTTQIFAIGGGELGDLETEAIDREIVGAAGRDRPRALFVPTASDDAESYWEIFQRIYGDHFGCETEVLCLRSAPPPFAAIAEAVERADLIYVGGGNTLRMMRRWRRLGFNRLLHEANQRGVVLAGLSAGALCWFSYGHSDSMGYYHPDDWRHIRVRGLGFIPATGCPHYNSERRDEAFHETIRREGGVGIALDDGCALHVAGDHYRLLTSLPNAGAYRVIRRRGRVEQQPLGPAHQWRPLEELFTVTTLRKPCCQRTLAT